MDTDNTPPAAILLFFWFALYDRIWRLQTPNTSLSKTPHILQTSLHKGGALGPAECSCLPKEPGREVYQGVIGSTLPSPQSPFSPPHLLLSLTIIALIWWRVCMENHYTTAGPFVHLSRLLGIFLHPLFSTFGEATTKGIRHLGERLALAWVSLNTGSVVCSNGPSLDEERKKQHNLIWGGSDI